ncbi:hypothetical protein RhiTH_005445 [Rhizoctonia solani]
MKPIIGYVPPSFCHYVENIGNTTLKYLDIFKTDVYQDISLNQWLTLTPPDMVKKPPECISTGTLTTR